MFKALAITSLWLAFAFGLPTTPGGQGDSIRVSLTLSRTTPVSYHCVQATRATCADTSLTQTVIQAFRTDTFVHCLNYRQAFASSNAVNRLLKYANQLPAFRGWTTQQDSTVPLFQLGTADRKQYIYRIGTDARTPPTVSGFNTDVYLVAWVYNAPVCGSVPLYSVFLPGYGDRYTTINPYERNTLITVNGWADDGIVAYVLPL